MLIVAVLGGSIVVVNVGSWATPWYHLIIITELCQKFYSSFRPVKVDKFPGVVQLQLERCVWPTQGYSSNPSVQSGMLS